MGVTPWVRGARAAVTAGVSVAALACATDSGRVQYVLEGVDLTTPDGLHRVEDWGFGYAFVKPGADLARYDSVVIGPVGVAYKPAPRPEFASRDGIEKGTYLLSPTAAGWFEFHLRKALAIELGKNEGFRVAEQPVANALRVRAYVFDLVVRVPPDQGVGKAYTSVLRDRGEFILILDVRDAESGAPLLRVGDYFPIKFDGALGSLPSNPTTNTMAAREIFQRAAARLRRRLDEVRALPEIPPVPAS